MHAKQRARKALNLCTHGSHTAGERNGIFAFRPAPVQVVYLAFPGTHGATYLDYNVVDMTVSPEQHRHLFTEKLIYMPHCYQVRRAASPTHHNMSHHMPHVDASLDTSPQRSYAACPCACVCLCVSVSLAAVQPCCVHAYMHGGGR